MSEPSWAETIKGAIERSLDGVHTSIPAQVRTYLPATQQCSVEPVIPGMPVLEDVPVLWPSGGGHFVHLPLTTGDYVLLTFCEQDFSPWRLSGSATAPALLRRHGLFAFAVPGARPDVAPLVTPSTLTGAAIGVDGGILVQVTAAGIQLGGVAAAIPVTLDVALKSAVAAACTAALAAKVPGDGGTAAFTAFAASFAAAVTASTIVKATA